MINFQRILKAISLFTEITSRAYKAKQADSPGGEELTPDEIAEIAASVAAMLADGENKKPEISADLLVKTWQACGWTVTD